MKKHALPYYNKQGKRILFPGMNNFGDNSYEVKSGLHRFILKSKYILKGEIFWDSKKLDIYAGMRIKIYEN